MHYLLIYFETLIFMTFYILFKKFQDYMKTLGDTSEWYARNKVHFWERHKVHEMLEEEFGTKKKRKGND